ncbi:tetratricopeptide repeat protein [uncultured Algoriphagus sp.]|uniref:tetratricopeptide repeat protein n=1 Tax=uncultured Algoriphagus sp. TaxID=417365 RepID=UPI0030EB87D3|tara:strand:+ start:20696 stop:22399 length:1704 start_codon:yes stop_codon:yes gene_type:complete
MAKIVFGCFLSFVFSINFANAQYSRLLHKSHWEQTEALSDLYDDIIEAKVARPIFEDTLAGMKKLAILEKDEVLQMEADFLELSYELLVEYRNADRMIAFQKEQEKNGNIYFACRAAEAISKSYWYAKDYEKTLFWHLHLDELMKEVSIDEFPEKAIFLTGIGSDYRYFGDYKKAISYFKRVTDFPVKDIYINAWRHSMNNMGYSYRQLGQLDSSDIAFNRLLVHAAETSEQWVGIASGNIGYNHYLKGEFDEAIPFLMSDVEIAETYKDFGLAAQSCIPLADIYIQKDQLKLAKEFIDKSTDYIELTGQTDRFRHLYPVMSKWETAMSNAQKAQEYLDSSLVFNKRYNEKFSALQLMRADQTIKASQKEQAIQKLSDEARRNRIVRNSIIGGLLLVVIAGLIINHSQQQKNQVQRNLNEMKLKQAQQDLDNAKNLLKSYTNKIHSNSKIISSIEDSEPSDEQTEILLNLKASTILTEEDWGNFQIQFNKIFPGLIENLQSLSFNISPAEMRYLLLLKLKLQNIEIAHALGISPSSLRVTWHRLRKKLELDKDFQPSQIHNELFSEL